MYFCTNHKTDGDLDDYFWLICRIGLCELITGSLGWVTYGLKEGVRGTQQEGDR